jgi:hypothetical protein
MMNVSHVKILVFNSIKLLAYEGIRVPGFSFGFVVDAQKAGKVEIKRCKG